MERKTGLGRQLSVRATATMTLALPKEGLRMTEAREAVGELYLADISVPPSLYAGPNLGFDAEPFHGADVIRIWLTQTAGTT